MKLAGARILVVGGVRKLGRTLALDLATHGAAVCVTTRRQDPEASQVSETLLAAGAPAATVASGDVSTAASAGRLVDDGAAALGGLDGLVFAASGPFAPSPPQDLTAEAWDASFGTIARGFFFAARAAREHMTASTASPQATSPPATPPDVDSGVIVALTDLLGVQPWGVFAAHGAAKAAQIHLVKALALAWAADGIRVCGVAPGPLDLPDDERREATLRAAHGDTRRLVQPADVAAAVRFCFATRGLTGVDIPVDHGALLSH